MGYILSRYFLTFRDEDGFYTDIFDEPKSVPMSSYLVAVAIGDLEYMESTINNITVSWFVGFMLCLNL